MDERTESLISRVHQVLELAAQQGVLDLSRSGLPQGWANLDAGLAVAEQQLRKIADSGTGTGNDAIRTVTADVLCREVAVLRSSLLTHEMGRRHEMMHKADQALQRLRSAATVDEFVSRLPCEIVNLGYLRALFSQVDQMRWVARSAHSSNGPEESRLLVQAGQQRPFRALRGMFEFEMVRRRQPILHHGIRGSAQVHPDIMKITQSDSFLAAPLVAGNAVVGFVSLDVNVGSGSVDAFDRDLIGFLCGGAGIALERIRALDGLKALQNDVERNVEDLQSLLVKRGHTMLSSPVDIGPSIAHDEFGAEPPAALSSVLTRREEQILELLARGLTNSQIGDRLYITEGTAKTHVKSVLRKLGASNRTEASDIYRRQRTILG